MFKVFFLTKEITGRISVLRDWVKNRGVLIIGYEMLKNVTSQDYTDNEEDREFISCCLIKPGPQLVVCDEGHILKNDKTAISSTVSKIETRRKIILTGTPVQNNLGEYYVMIQLVKPEILGSLREFCDTFMDPITKGQAADSSDNDVRIMKTQGLCITRTA